LTAFSKRDIVVYDLPLPDGTKILHPERVLIRFGGKQTIDIGALCYLRRDESSRRANEARNVDLTSFSQIRADHVHELLHHVSESYSTSGNRWTTQFSNTSNFILYFMQFADSMGYEDVLGNSDVARVALAGYVNLLREQARSNHLSINTVTIYQNSAAAILCGLFDVDNMVEGLNLLHRNKNATENTRPPCETAQSKILALCEAIFYGFSDLVLKNLPYPYRLDMPEYLEWENNFLWVFPTVIRYMPPHLQARRGQLKRPSWAFDYAHGRLADFESIKRYYNQNCAARFALVKAERLIAQANNDPHYHARTDAAMTALNAFVVLFMANIAMNRAQLLELPWSDKYEIGVERQGFRTIKWRAAGRKCYFEIQSTFLPTFKHFLLLRKYLLGDVGFRNLFFTLGTRSVSKPSALGGSIFEHFYETLRHIDPHLPKVTPREWRAAKSDWLIRNTDLSTAAKVMQNDENSLLKHYAAGSEILHVEEMTNFFDRVTETVKNRGIPIEGVDQAVGVCSSFGAPHQIRYNSPIVPDCKGAEGCLFCDKYRIHADERDTRKLLSCRYCLRQTAHFAENEEQYQKIFTPIFYRMEEVLEEIDRRESGIVEKVRIQVEEYGELDPYWNSKLEMLVSLGMVVC
jgi:hypothetical protein